MNKNNYKQVATRRLLTSVLALFAAVSTIFAVPAKPDVLRQLLEQGDTARYNEMIAHERNIHQHANEMAAHSSARRVVTNAEGTTSLNLAPKGLLILANYADVKFKANNTPEAMQQMLNGDTYNYGSSYGSARQYFYDQSNHQYHPYFDVVGPVDLPKNMSYYGKNDSRGNDSKCGDLVLHACSIASQIDGVNFADYDNDNDGVLDFVYIIYAGYNEAEGASANTIWPASWEMSAAIYSGCTELSTSDWSNYSKYTFDGKIISSFAYSSELRGTSGSNRAGIGTFCHEFSHVIGLPDYYDTNYGTNYNNDLTPNGWSLMDGGSYNVNGQVPPSYSIYDKWFVGWVTPEVLNTTQHVTMPADGLTGYYINSSGKSGSPTSTATTYYLENRQKTGWDQGLPGHGMLVWQVKYSQSAWDQNSPNNTANAPKISIYNAAAGKVSDVGKDYNTFPGSMNVTTFKPYAAYPVTNIKETSGVIDFDFMYGDYYLAGNGGDDAEGIWCNGLNWEPRGINLGLSCTLTFKSVPAGTWQFKVTDGTWNNSWGYSNVDAATSTPNYTEGENNNVVFQIASAADITITFVPATKLITLTSTVPFEVPSECFVIDQLPYTEDFETTDENTLPECWFTNNAPYCFATTTAHNSNRGVMLYGGKNITMLLLPDMNIDLQTSEVTLYYLNESFGADYGKLYIGAVNFDNTPTILSELPQAEDWTYYACDLSQAPADTRYLIIILYNGQADGIAHVDDITLQEKSIYTSTDEVISPEMLIQKFLRDGHIYIRRGGDMFTIEGLRL